jgi:stage II sporulation protein AA (anti-sigma F factor antagonist)
LPAGRRAHDIGDKGWTGEPWKTISLPGNKDGKRAMIPSEKTRGKVLVLKPEGRLDSNTVNAAEADLFSYLEKGETRVVLDLSQLDYISSSGLRLVLMMGKRLSFKEGKLALCGLKPQIREVFEISGFISILTVVGTREEAEAAVLSR